jgi:hypothetical protein
VFLAFPWIFFDQDRIRYSERLVFALVLVLVSPQFCQHQNIVLETYAIFHSFKSNTATIPGCDAHELERT